MTNACDLYKHVLVPVENSSTDETILCHVIKLAGCCGSRITLIHVADGFMARNQQRLTESAEMVDDRNYLERRKNELAEAGFVVEAVLVCGEPATEILKFAEKSDCDLIAMGTHGHKGLSGMILGSVASMVRLRTHLPVLLVKDVASR